MNPLEEELKQLIVSSLQLEEVKPSDIDSEEPLFGDSGLALDSIDALEIGVQVQKKYGVKIDPEDEHVSEYFRNVRSLANYIANKK
jgi:acyl carrier protein